MPWRFELNKYIDESREGDMYHFGIWFGDSMINTINTLKTPERFKHFAFDSFKGLPLDPNEPLWHPEWHPETGYQNAYSAETWAGTDDPGEVIEKVIHYVNSKTIYKEGKRIIYLPGYFEESLADDLLAVRMDMKPAVYIDVDVDIYTSSIECLDFVARNGLIVKGTIIGFDDWKCTPDWERCRTGESRAWLEIQDKYGIASHFVFDSPGLNNWIVEVDHVG